MVTIHSQKARILITAPQGEFPKLFENGALRLLCAREVKVLESHRTPLPIVGHVPMQDIDPKADNYDPRASFKAML